MLYSIAMNVLLSPTSIRVFPSLKPSIYNRQSPFSELLTFAFQVASIHPPKQEDSERKNASQLEGLGRFSHTGVSKTQEKNKIFAMHLIVQISLSMQMVSLEFATSRKIVFYSGSIK